MRAWLALRTQALHSDINSDSDSARGLGTGQTIQPIELSVSSSVQWVKQWKHPSLKWA
jgi:hypothetical protein